ARKYLFDHGGVKLDARSKSHRETDGELETDSPVPDDSTTPEVAADEPIAALPRRETARVWAETEPVVRAEDSADAVDPQATADEALPPPLPSGKGDPDWAEPESSTDVQPGNKSPEWAQPVPT